MTKAKPQEHCGPIRKLITLAARLGTTSQLSRELLAMRLAGEDGPTDEQNNTFLAWFETEVLSGNKQADLRREQEMIAIWRKLHPGTLPGKLIIAWPQTDRSSIDDEIPF